MSLDLELQKFKERVLSLLDAKGGDYYFEENIDEFAKLLIAISAHENTLKNRSGKKKAELISDWLSTHGCNSRVLKIKNKDKDIEANQDNYWYMVEATVGNDSFVKNGNNGLLAVHHDQVARSETTVQFKDGRLHIPSIIDDTIHIVAAMYEFSNFNRWYLENKENIKEDFCVKLIVSDGEEVNTTGMKHLLNKWHEEGKLERLSYMVIGESTASTQHSYIPGKDFLSDEVIPGVAYANRGKVAGKLIVNNDGLPVSQLVHGLFSLTRVWQEYFHTESTPGVLHSTKESPHHTEFIPTVNRFDKSGGTMLWELRTNKEIGARHGLELIQRLLKDISGVKRDRLVSNAYIECNPAGIYRYAVHAKGSYVDIDMQDNLHPAWFILGKKCDPLLLSIFFLAGLPENERPKLTSIEWGDVKKSNTLPRFTKLNFSEGISFDTAINKMIKPDYEELVASYIEEGLEIVRSIALDIKIVPNQVAGCREGLEVSDNDWDLVESARDNLTYNLKRYFNCDLTPAVKVFNAMHDGGPTTYEYIYPILWRKGERLITLGAGDFNKLHGDESLNPAEFAMGMIQYKGLLQTLTFPGIK